MLWDFNWFRPRQAAATIKRVSSRLRAGDIVVMHDGDESAPRKDQPQTVEATRQLIPAVRKRGFTFGTVCQNGVSRVTDSLTHILGAAPGSQGATTEHVGHM